jgi:dihydropteroate synthase
MIVRAGDRTLAFDGRPLLMGILNATPDSFSGDGPRFATPEARPARAHELASQGAEVIDVGGESQITTTPPLRPEEEIERVAPLIERVAAEVDAVLSVDTYKPAVAEAAVAAGAGMVNDVSGLRDAALADVCARSGAALVVMHTRGAPKQKVLDHTYADVGADVTAFLRERMALAVENGVTPEQLVVDPGPDFAKTPAQTVAALRGLPALRELGRPILLAVSRKDFVGALTGRPPAGRGAGTLAALAFGVDAGADLLRVHDVAAAADFLAVRAALLGEAAVDPDLRLADELRREGNLPDTGFVGRGGHAIPKGEPATRKERP